MLGLAEYRVFQVEHDALGNYFGARVQDQTTGIVGKDPRINAALGIYRQYHIELKDLIYLHLLEIGYNAVNYYYEDAKPAGLVEEQVAKLYKEQYYGATLNQRLYIQQRRLLRSVSTWGGQWTPVEKQVLDPLTDLNILATRQVQQRPAYNRLFLGSAIKLEQNIAAQAAKDKDIPFIRWTLSHKHATPDICDDLATATDKAVVKLIQERNLNINARGLYLPDQLPQPPHPNCQCEYTLESGTQRRDRAVRRTLQRIRTLLRRMRRK